MMQDDSLYIGVADGLHRVTEVGLSSYEIVLIAIVALYLLWLSKLVTRERRHTAESVYSSVHNKDDSQKFYAGDSLLAYIMVVVSLTLVTTQLLGSHDWTVLFVVTLGWHALFAAKSFVLWLSCYLSYNEPMFEAVVKCKLGYFVKTVVWLMPISLGVALLEQSQVAFYVAIFQCFAVLIGYIYRSNVLFRSKKISIFSWILYLCTVEIAPTFLLWLILSSKFSVN